MLKFPKLQKSEKKYIYCLKKFPRERVKKNQSIKIIWGKKALVTPFDWNNEGGEARRDATFLLLIIFHFQSIERKKSGNEKNRTKKSVVEDKTDKTLIFQTWEFEFVILQIKNSKVHFSIKQIRAIL